MWQYAKGCVIILISGYRADRLLERMRQNGVTLREVRFQEGSITARIQISDFKRLRAIARRSRCRVRILEKRGLPFRVRRIWRRPALWITALVCALAMTFLSTRVLSIQVEGTHRVPQKLILRALKENGVFIGSAKPKTDLISLAASVRAYDARIAWAEILLDGVKLRVSLTESPRVVKPVDTKQPHDVCAVKDGTIRSIEVYDGLALVKAGDYVFAGDTLISGVVPLEGIEQPLSVHARGIVTARVSYFGEYAALPTQETLVDGAGREPYRLIRVRDLILFETKPSFEHYEIRSVGSSMATDLLIPITIAQGTIVERVIGESMLTRAEQTELALVEAERVAMLKVPKDARILEKTTATREQDGAIIGVVGVITEETIGLEREIQY